MEEKNNNIKPVFVFDKSNYKLLLIGIAVNLIGYLLMIGGAASSPDEFNAEELFSTRRITIAPIVIMIGFGIIFYSIIKKPSSPKEKEDLTKLK